jgi:fructokinase
MSANTEFPLFVSAGDILTDLVRTGASQWLSRPARFADGLCRVAGRR